MKVLLVHGWHPIEGGTEGYFETLRRGLSEAGDEVRLLVSSAGSAARGTADYVAHGTTRLASQALLQLHNPWAAATVERAVREFGPEVAVVGVFADFLSPGVFAPLAGVPTIAVVTDYKVVCPNSRKLLPDGSLCVERHGLVCLAGGCSGALRWLRDRPRYALIRRALARADRVVTCGEHIRGVLEAGGLAAAALDWPVRLPPPGFPRRPSAEPAFLYAGRLSAEKGVAQLVEAFAALLPQFPKASLRVAGEGGERAALGERARRRGLADRVSFLGWLGPEELEREFAAAWCLVAPSLWAEPLGLSALEAMVRGVPVIASRTGGFAETVRCGETGLLVRNGDVEALARAMRAIAARQAFPGHAVSEEGRRALLLRHDPTRHLETLRGLLSELAVRGRAGPVPH